MNLDKFLVVAGAPGVHKLVSSRPNGVIIEDRKEGRTRFMPVRQQQVTPLATVAVYTFTNDGEGTVPLIDVFQKMLDLLDTTPAPDHKSVSTVLRDYFTAILPEHDRDRVHIGDIQKCIKWFNFMLEHGIFEEAKLEAENSEPTKEVKIPVAEAEVSQPSKPVKEKKASK